MRTFLKWLAIQGLIWALAFVGGHYLLGGQPARILIGVDASFSMGADWPKVHEIIERYRKKTRYAEFALVTGKGRVHGWQATPDLSTVVTYGPRHLDRITDSSRYAEIGEADKRVLITNARDATFSGWDVVQP